MDLHHREVYFQTDAGQPYEAEPISFDQPVGDLDVVDDARWSADVTGNSWSALIVWILLLVVLQAAAWPIVRNLFARFPDRGWGFARLISLLSSGWVVWYLASLNVIAFRAIWIWAVVATVALAAWILFPLLSRRIPQPAPHRQDNRSFSNPSIVAAEGVFWAVFLLFLGYRLINPDSYHPAWGGEKPMELAHINAILRSPHFPPIDPWYADGYINYYYYGGYLVAFMLKLTGIPSEIAFNLAQPTFAALLASGAFSVGAALAHRASRSRKTTVGGGLLATVLMSLSGNLIAAARALASLNSPSPSLDNFDYWFWAPSRVPAIRNLSLITEFPYFSATYADLHAHVVALPITVLVVGVALALALDARGVAVAMTAPLRSLRRTANVLALLLLLALCLGSLFMTNAWDVPTFAAVSAAGILMATRSFSGIGRRLSGAAVLTVATGGLAYLVALPFTRHYVTLVSEVAQVRDQSSLLSIESHLGVFLLIIPFALCALLYRRAHATHLLSDPVMWAALLTSILLIRWYGVGRAPRISEWADIGTVLVVVGMTLLATSRTIPSRVDFRLPAGAIRWGTVLVWTVTVWALGADRPVLALFSGLALAAGLLWFSLSDTTERFMVMMIAGAFLVAAGTELVYLVDDLSGGPAYKMNTVFKFYNGIWSLLALASAGLLARVLAMIVVPSKSVKSARSEDSPHLETPLQRLSSHWTVVVAVIGMTAIIASLAFPVFSTSARLSQHFAQRGAHRTLNALDWMDYGTIPTGRPTADDVANAKRNGYELASPVTLSFAEDRAVIEWFNAEVPGTPVIAEASINPYRCGGSRISIHTGLPVVIGWVRHQQQQRYQDHLVQRQNDLRRLYTSNDPAEKERIIDRYRIRYIIVGDLERYYLTNNCLATENEGGIQAFSPLIGATLEVAFTAGETTVYRVL